MADYSLCKINDCANPEKSGGFCSAHYQRLRKFGDPLIGGPVKKVLLKNCKYDGCQSVANIGGGSKGFCNKHYLRFKKFGDPSISAIDREASECKAPGCTRGKPLSLGYCTKHYARFKTYGHTTLPQDSRFGRKIRWLNQNRHYQKDDCLIWPFATNGTGRGIASINGKSTSAPRVMCILAHGEPPSAKHHAAHSCGNGHNGCINPNHLSWKTAKENEADKLVHGTSRRGAAINTAKLSEDDVKSIRNRIASGDSCRDLADHYHVGVSSIFAIKNRKAWAWLE